MCRSVSLKNIMQLTQQKYRADIDGLRAIAILSVIGFHTFPQLFKGGFIGVDVFFVISGFLISGIIFESLDKNSFSYYDFYTRRIKRIFPALILVLITSFVFGWYLLLPDEYAQLGKHITAGASFSSNLTLWNEAGYFDKASNTKPLLHLWSLSLEEQFYILWPLILGMAWRYRLNFLPIVLLIAVMSFAVNVFTASSNPVANFYSPLSRFWELMIGGILSYYLTFHKSNDITRITNWQSIIGLLLIAVVVLISKDTVFPNGLVILSVFGAFLIISAHPDSWGNHHVLKSRALVLIGLISYPLYLWHWPIITFLRINKLNNTTNQIAAILVSFLLSLVTYWLIEKPIRKNKANNMKIIILCIFLIIIGYIGLNTYQRKGLNFRMTKLCPELTGSKPETRKHWRKDQCFLVDDEHKFADNCLETKKPLLFLWGDSHAAALYPGFKKMQHDYQFGIAQYTTAGCKPLAGKVTVDHKFCKEMNDTAVSIIEKTKPDIVFLHAYWNSITDLNDLETTINLLKDIGIKKIVLLGPDPTWNEELIRIIFAYYHREHKIPPLRMKENNASIVQKLDESMRNFAQTHKVQYISSLNILCNKDGCLTRTGANNKDIIARDSNHLTPQGSYYQVKIIFDSQLKFLKTAQSLAYQ